MSFKALILPLFLFSLCGLNAQVKFEKEVKISDKGLHFNGKEVESNAKNNGTDAYDYFFGDKITPHGDCIKEYDGFVFMTWYRGGKNDRHVMLSRYNTRTGVLKTIEFPHQHNGYLNQWWIGESHNTIAVGVCPIDGTVHMLYDLHAYSRNHPKDKSLANDYFRYTYSKKNAATVPDDQFTIDQFVKGNDGDYKQLTMRPGTNYEGLTYPNFFLNKKGELFMWIREGGNTDGAYKFCKYDGKSWSDFTSFNVTGAKRHPDVDRNWGLYGDIKFSGGKMRIAFARRSQDPNDQYQFNNGLYYAYTDDPNGKTQWKTANDQPLTLPIFDSEPLKVAEPSEVLKKSGKNSVVVTRGTDWIVTDRGDIHATTTVGTGSEQISVHTYRKAGARNFTRSTSYPGGDLYTFKNEVYLIGHGGGRVFVEKAEGGTNNWEQLYRAPTNARKFSHGRVYISDDGKIYYFLMEKKSGSAQPIYLQILDLGLENSDKNGSPLVDLTSPANNATFELGDLITLSAGASDPDGDLDKVNFFVNDEIVSSDSDRPFETTFTPTATGTYTIVARAIDKENARTDATVTITVVEKNRAPIASFTTPVRATLEEGYPELLVTVEANDPNGDAFSILLKINGREVRSESAAPYEWGHAGSPDPLETVGLPVGRHLLEAVATDAKGLSTTISRTLTVTERVITSTNSALDGQELSVYPNPSETGMFQLTQSMEWEVYSLSGTKILSGKSDLIDLSLVSKGMYILKVEGKVLQLLNQ